MTGRTELLDWYLANLRKLALSRHKTHDLTPMNLLHSDEALLQQIVAAESNEIPAEIESRPSMFLDWRVYLTATIVGLLVLIGLYLRQ